MYARVSQHPSPSRLAPRAFPPVGAPPPPTPRRFTTQRRMNPSSTRAPRPRGDERGSTTTTTTLTTTTTTRRDARSTRTPRPAVAPDRVSRTPTPPARSIETRSIGRHHHHPRRHHRPLATTTRRRTDRRSTTKTSRLFFSSRLRHRLRLRTVASSVAPLRPHSRVTHIG